MVLKKKNKYKSNLYNKLIGYFVKNGKKNQSEQIINKSLQTVSAVRQHYSTSFDIINGLENTLKLEMDTKQIKLRKRIIVIPVPINFNRQSHLVVKRILSGFSDKKIHIKLKNKMVQEYVGALENDSQGIINKYEKIMEIKSNKANTHFRW